MYNQKDTEDYFREGSISFKCIRWLNQYVTIFHDLVFCHVKHDSHHERHRHQFYEYIIPQDNDYRCLLNGREIAVPIDQILLVQPGDLHEDILVRDCRFTAITFDLKLQEPTLKTFRIFRDNLPPEAQILAIPPNDPFWSILELLKNESANSLPTTYDILSGLFRALFWQSVRSLPIQVLVPALLKTSVREAFKSDLLKIFEENVNGKLNVGLIAERMNMSESSLSHRCREYFGKPPAQAFQTYKLKKAEQFVRHAQLPIKEISDTFGFENQFHFSRLFKKIYGMSPMQYRIHKKEYP